MNDRVHPSWPCFSCTTTVVQSLQRSRSVSACYTGAVHRRRGSWSKNQALFSGRVPHVRPSVHGPKTDFSNAFIPSHEESCLCHSLCPGNKSAGRGCARLFRPMYAEANMGHPSRTTGSRHERRSAGFGLHSNPDNSAVLIKSNSAQHG
jgi:hypothetical protein